MKVSSPRQAAGARAEAAGLKNQLDDERTRLQHEIERLLEDAVVSRQTFQTEATKVGGDGGCTRVVHDCSHTTILLASHPHNDGTEHVGFSPTSTQALGRGGVMRTLVLSSCLYSCSSRTPCFCLAYAPNFVLLFG